MADFTGEIGALARPLGRAHWLCAEHVRQLGGESPLLNLVANAWR